jgi:hypothetical protein
MLEVVAYSDGVDPLDLLLPFIRCRNLYRQVECPTLPLPTQVEATGHFANFSACFGEESEE